MPPSLRLTSGEVASRRVLNGSRVLCYSVYQLLSLAFTSTFELLSLRYLVASLLPCALFTGSLGSPRLAEVG